MDTDDFYESECGYFAGMESKMELEWLLPEDVCKDVIESISADGYKPSKGYSYQEDYFSTIMASGWRRSGEYVYRNTCPHCKKCIPIRVAAADFIPSKSQRKAVRKNADVEISLTSDPKDFVTDEKVQLFKMYDKRHNPDTVSDDRIASSTLRGLNGLSKDGQKTYSGTFNMEYRLDGKLIAVGVVDRAMHALSSNYFYYDTSDEILKRSLGVFSMLMEIEACRGNLFDGKLKSDYHYLGYYIADCNKMNYKNQYKPYQLLIDEKWTEFE